MNAQTNPNDPLWIVFTIVIVMCSILYWLPSFIAFARHHSQRWFILVFNFVLSATIVGWIIAMVWACSETDQQPKKE